MIKGSRAETPSISGMHDILNAMSVDVEEYFQVGAFENCIAKDSWGDLESRVSRSTHEILDLFSYHQIKSTFFCLGWVAERHGALIRRIVDDGHELASHGYDHQRVFQLSEREFREDVKRTQGILEDAGGVAVKGYRAPSFSVDQRSPWAHQILAELGYRYSSSVYPIKHDHYGVADAPRRPYMVADGALLEIPMTTLLLGKKRLPSSGGGFFRLLPYAVSKWMLDRVNAVDEMPACFYMHPWEVDPDQPVQHQAPLKSRFRHYVNLSRTKSKLARLLEDFNWSTVSHVYLGED